MSKSKLLLFSERSILSAGAALKIVFLICCWLLGGTLASNASAAIINVNLGVFSFDVLNPPSGQFAGVNQFTIYDFTGANDLEPDFPVISDITFQNTTVDVGQGPINLGSIASDAGGVQPLSLMFLSTDNFVSASFAATLSTNTIELADGTVVDLSSDQISGLILPSQGNSLTAGVDFALLTVTGTVAGADVPEPGTLSFAFIALVFLAAADLAPKSRLHVIRRGLKL